MPIGSLEALKNKNQRSFNNQQMAKGFLSAIKEYGNIKAEQSKIKADLLANEFKAKQNYFYQQKEKDADLERQKQLLREYSGMGGQAATAEDEEMGSAPYGRMVPNAMKVGGMTFVNPNAKKQPGGKTLFGPQVDKISKNESAIFTLDESVASLEDNKDRFSQFLGPGKGLLRNPARSYVNKDLQDFIAWKANVQDAFQQYRVAVTGAQASDKEIALLAKNRPNENDTYDVFVKKAREVRKIGNMVLGRYIQNLGRAGYNISGFQDTLARLNDEMGGLTETKQDQGGVQEKIQKAREAGYTDEEIDAYLRGGQ
jgi:hypothetical protein